MAVVKLVDYQIEDPRTNAQVETGWLGYKVYLTHQEIEDLSSGAFAVGVLIGDPKVAAAVGVVMFGLRAICALGGHKGVSIIGTWLFPLTPVVLPGNHL